MALCLFFSLTDDTRANQDFSQSAAIVQEERKIPDMREAVRFSIDQFRI